MVRIKNPNEYSLLRFEKSKAKNKMYSAILKHKETGKTRKVSFGDISMENYRDLTGLNLYPHLIHSDRTRRKSFRKRFAKDASHKFSSAYFSMNYLW